ERLEIGNNDRIDDDGPLRLELRDILLENRIDLLEILGIGIALDSDRLPQDADARALEPSLVEETRIAAVGLADPERRHRILGIVAGHRIEKLGEVADAARHR